MSAIQSVEKEENVIRRDEEVNRKGGFSSLLEAV